MTPDEVISHFGGVQQTADECEVSYQAVKAWKDQGKVPKLRQKHIQLITEGKLVAEPSNREAATASA